VNSPNPAHGNGPTPSYSLTPQMGNRGLSSVPPTVNIIPADGSSTDSIGSYSLSSNTNTLPSNPYGSQSTGTGTLGSTAVRWPHRRRTSLDHINEDGTDSVTTADNATYRTSMSSSRNNNDGRWFHSNTSNPHHNIHRQSRDGESMDDIDETAEYGVATRVSTQNSPLQHGGGWPTGSSSINSYGQSSELSGLENTRSPHPTAAKAEVGHAIPSLMGHIMTAPAIKEEDRRRHSSSSGEMAFL